MWSSSFTTILGLVSLLMVSLISCQRPLTTYNSSSSSSFNNLINPGSQMIALTSTTSSPSSSILRTKTPLTTMLPQSGKQGAEEAHGMSSSSRAYASGRDNANQQLQSNQKQQQRQARNKQQRQQSVPPASPSSLSSVYGGLGGGGAAGAMSSLAAFSREINKSDGSISGGRYSSLSSLASNSGTGNPGRGIGTRVSVNDVGSDTSPDPNRISLTQYPPHSATENGPSLHQSQRGKKLNALNTIRNTILQRRPIADDDRQRDDPDSHKTYEDPLQLLKKRVLLNGTVWSPTILNPGRISESDHEMEDFLGVRCDFETECAWHWEENLPDGFHVVTGANLTSSNMTGMMPGPKTDATKDANGHFLHVRLVPGTNQRILTSPQFSTTRESCYLELLIHQSSMSEGSVRIVIEPLRSEGSSWVLAEILGNDANSWEPFQARIGRVSKDFQILLEVVSNDLGGRQRGHVSIDNLRMQNCFPNSAMSDTCSISQVKCRTNKVQACISIPRICDIAVDCDVSEDELQNCDKIPFGGRCDFENGWCGWHNSGKAILMWAHHSGPTPTEKTGPDQDHTYLHTNITGHYMFVNMNQHANDSEKKKLVGFASNAVMNSVIFNPPPSVHANDSSPYRNSCVVRFYVHQFGMNAGSINLSVVEMKGKENITTTLWWSSKNLGEDWIRAVTVIPNITSKYFLQFEARMGMRIYSDVAVDDFSLSPECFGINIPAEHLQGYNYWDPRVGVRKQAHKDFENKTAIELSTCGSRGIFGPTVENCTEAYNNTQAANTVKVVDKSPFIGTQLWKVPNEGYYTIIAKGAGGGLGSGGVGSSRGAMSIAVLELHKNEEIYILVGQAGEHACIKSLGLRDDGCESIKTDPLEEYASKLHIVKNIKIKDGAGGGGGASYVFLLNSAKVAVPLLVAGGGGGLGIGRYLDDDFQHGQIFMEDRLEVSGQVHGDLRKAAGPGGGWRANEDNALNPTAGAALLQGARGGVPCYQQRVIHGQGGFGGGGGGCSTGGGGGGYSGGHTFLNATNGEGGTSYIGMRRAVRELSAIYDGANSGPGSVIIIPAIQGCGCDYRCIALDEFRSLTHCICPDRWRLKKDNNTACEMISEAEFPLQYWIIFFAIITILLMVALTSLILILYNRYQRKKQAALRHKMLLEQDLQLSRLRHNADDSALTNFNPNYGCDGILNGNVDVKSLPQVARESLRLLKALGQGAFGEVYQGLYRHRDGDAVEMPVAVKTLPEMSTGQAEADFLMEAAIMAKFNHPNIVHLIGVCFDRHPRYIVLELLAGGDLKNFLREGRNKPERPSPLTMKDMVFCAVDVAKGCRYMESKRFIHRDIAARNCLLSSKGPGRVVKIADFGMARDIYRSDYYRKGGKAMLPIKWMPPEAFLDGIFTSKTDVWSFGVLLWEVFSLGLMPYTGLPNRDVMQLVTGGGRLDAPPGCPPSIYRVMADCWNPTPEERPSFATLLERLTACTQDPEVMNAPLPLAIFRPSSSEPDHTIMRPPGNDDFCLQVPNSSDYLVPLPGPRSVAERLLSEATGVTLSETVTTCSAPIVTSPSAPKHYDENGGCWETSFMMPNSKSDQPLIVNDVQNGIDSGDSEEIIMNNHHRTPHSSSILNDEEDTKLISLDTPQPTPTTIQPPISFAQMDGITLDAAALNKNATNQNHNHQQQKMSYANVQMMNSLKNKQQLQQLSEIPTEKINGNGGSFDGSSSTISANSAPFTIQGYNDRYNMSKDNHSEISC